MLAWPFAPLFGCSHRGLTRRRLLVLGRRRRSLFYDPDDNWQDCKLEEGAAASPVEPAARSRPSSLYSGMEGSVDYTEMM